MRIENFMPTAVTNYLQFYINCAFVNIIGPGGGIPTEFVRFPGTYQDEDPGKQEQIAELHLSNYLLLILAGLQASSCPQTKT